MHECVILTWLASNASSNGSAYLLNDAVYTITSKCSPTLRINSSTPGRFVTNTLCTIPSIFTGIT